MVTIQIFIVALLFITVSSQGQFYYQHDQKIIDSLEKSLNNATGIEKTDLMNQLAETLAKYNPDRADSLATLALDMSVQAKYTRGEGLATFNKGYIHYLDGDLVEAMNDYQKAIELLQQAGDKRSLAHIYNLMVIVLYFSHTDPDPMRYFTMALDYYLELNDSAGLAYTYMYLGGGGIRTGRDREAIDWTRKYFKYMKGYTAASLFQAIGYAVIGDAYGDLGMIDSAIYYYDISARTFNTDYIEERAVKSQIVATAGEYYLEMGFQDSTIALSQRALDLSRSIGHLLGLMRAHYFLAKIYAMEKQYEMVIAHCDSAIAAGREIESSGYYFSADSLYHYIGISEEIFFVHSKSTRREDAWYKMNQAYQLLWDALNELGKYYEATQIVLPWANVKDSLDLYYHQKELREINTRYETERKERELEQLSEENQFQALQIRQTRIILIGLAGIIFMGLIITVLLIRQNRIRTEQEKTNLQRKLFRMQMNPHFIFNSLSSIQGFIMEKDHKTATRYLSRFAQLVRNILDYAAEEFVPLDKEISTIENYLELQKVRYEGKFDYRIEVDENIEPETIEIPPMLSQPFIENAIEHGIKTLDRKGNIFVRFNLQGNNLILEIQDDGIGREKAQQLLKQRDAGHRSLATRLTADRISAINKRKKEKIRFEVIDMKENGIAKGTIVTFVIPV